MSWIEALVPWIPLSLIAGRIYFFRDRIATLFDGYIQHRLDAKLEIVRDELRTRGQELEALRASPLGIRGQRQAEIDKRRLQAVDQLWGAVTALQPLKVMAMIMAALPWDKVSDHI